jgi:hypothetical protein
MFEIWFMAGDTGEILVDETGKQRIYKGESHNWVGLWSLAMENEIRNERFPKNAQMIVSWEPKS